MPPILHLVRHAQGYHAIEKEGQQLHDPAITPHGKKECDALRESFPYHDQIELLLASPLRRTIETALRAFSPCVDRGLRVVCVPAAQEATADPADTGSDPETIRGWFDDHVDLDNVKAGWNNKHGEFAPDVVSLKLRAKTLRQWIKARPEAQVVLVSHGYFAHYLTGHVDDNGQQTTGWWIDAEVRSFKFADHDMLEGEDAASIVELEESKEKRSKVRRETLYADLELKN